MIDTHCHLLAGLDDGPVSFNDSIRMARRLAENNVRLVVCTPHWSAQYHPGSGAAEAAFDRLTAALAALEIPLELRLAAEVSSPFAIEAPLEEILRRRLVTGFVLVELEPSATGRDIEQIIERLAAARHSPVFAHPERARAVQHKPQLLDDARAHGALVQVVAPSLVGSADAQVGRTAWKLIERGTADLVASDAHRPDSRRLQLRALADVVGQRFGQAVSHELFSAAPARLLGVGD